LTEQLSGCEAVKVFDEPVKTIVGCVAALVPEGPARTLLYVVVGLCATFALFIYKYYLGVLAQGAKPEGSLERLRASLKQSRSAALCEMADHFPRWGRAVFRRCGMADRTLFPRAFGLKTGAAVDGARLRLVPAVRFALPNRDDFTHLGHFRPCRSRGGDTSFAARSSRLGEGPFGGGDWTYASQFGTASGRRDGNPGLFGSLPLSLSVSLSVSLTCSLAM
jgi:hypothetical protein